MLQLAMGDPAPVWKHETTETGDSSPFIAPQTLSKPRHCIDKDLISLPTTPSTHTLPAVSSSVRRHLQTFALPTSVFGLPSCVRSMQPL